jgi:hypothetical protein
VCVIQPTCTGILERSIYVVAANIHGAIGFVVLIVTVAVPKDRTRLFARTNTLYAWLSDMHKFASRCLLVVDEMAANGQRF